ncbi:MAG: hypothetical protein R2712_24690 [Vicinamibacterales bacterium]
MPIRALVVLFSLVAVCAQAQTVPDTFDECSDAVQTTLAAPGPSSD